MRLKARTDRNHGEIRDALRAMGIRVYDASRVGGGFPDLVCSFGGFTMLVEVKHGRNGFTADQEGFAGDWQGALFIVRDLDGAQTVARFMRSQARKLQGAW